jgi:nitrite reductase/ring-hydroxylating ferredoxin subunit
MTQLGWTPALRADELAVGSGRRVLLRGRPVALFRDLEGFHALGAVCPHQGSLLSESLQDDGSALCPSHGWAFDLHSGRSTVFRSQGVRVYPARVVDGIVWVRVGGVGATLADLARRLAGGIRP